MKGLPTKFFCQLQGITRAREVRARYNELGAAYFLGSSNDILEIIWVSLNAAMLTPEDGIGQINSYLHQLRISNPEA